MNIGISEINRKAVAEALVVILADEFVLYAKTRNAHWNVVGHDFIEKHKLFESQYEQIDSIIDDVAERIRALGHFVPDILSEVVPGSTLKQEKFSSYNSANMIAVLLADHETIIRNLRNQLSIFANELQDSGTSDFVTGLMQDHEKAAWFLRAHLERS